MQNKLTYIFILVLSVGIIFVYFSIPKVAYINIDEVYSEFKMKKELESKLLSTQKEREKLLDSVQQVLTKNAAELQSLKKPDPIKYNQFNVQREEFSAMEDRLEEDTKAQMEQYKSQIGKQLNQYLNDFGNKNGYDFILGKDESFNVCFSKNSRDITNEVKKYVNELYEGGK